MPSFDEIRSSATAAMNKAKESVGLTKQEADPEQPPDRLEQLADACCPQLTFQQASAFVYGIRFFERRSLELIFDIFSLF
jgi:hypothetical protein